MIVSMLILLMSAQAKAAPAVSYNCIGKDKLSKMSVVFELLFSDHGPDVGYTNESITIVKKGWQTLMHPQVFQMYGATKRNHCSKNSLNEIYLHANFDMSIPSKREVADYRVSFKSSCAEAKFDVTGYCFFE